MALKDAAGLVKKFAMVDIQRYQNVAVGDTVADTQNAYETLLATNGVLTNETDLSDVKQVSGTIEKIAQGVVNGNSHFYVKLQKDKKLYDFALPGLLNIVLYSPGDKITFTYLESDDTHSVYSILDANGNKIASITDGTETASGENNQEGAAVDESAVESA